MVFQKLLNRLKGAIGVFRFIVEHPLNSGSRVSAIGRFIRWQIASRLTPWGIVVDYVNGARLVVRRGMSGGTGNIYAGLHDFEDMSFLLHLLRCDDLFVDVGANIGAYTILAAGAAGANAVSIEPIPSTYKSLIDNVNLNGLFKKVEARNIGIGAVDQVKKFTMSFDATNHVATSEDEGSLINVQIKKLDEIVDDRKPVLLKVDVEGFEAEVISGGSNVFGSKDLLAIIIELNGCGKRYGYDDDDLHQRILDYGFKPYMYHPFERRLAPMRGRNTKSNNTLYIRNIDEVSKRVKASQKYTVNGKTL